MSVSFNVEDLLAYSDWERRKWRDWINNDPRRLDIPFQDGGRFPSLWALLDHIFLVERRHLCRLQSASVPDATGVTPGDWSALFDYADLVRADLRRYITDLGEAGASTSFSVTIANNAHTLSRRKMLLHVLTHEIRHFAQLAYAARVAGQVPPGEHDLFFCPDLQ